MEGKEIEKDLSYVDKLPKYDIILADPCWKYNLRSGDTTFGKGAGLHYDMLATQSICDLNIQRICNKNCMLFMWVTCPELLLGGKAVLEAWGFKYKTVAFTWVKTNKNKGNFCVLPGYYTGSNIELCLLGVKGKPFKPDTKLVSQIVVAPRMEHSRKPNEVHEKIDLMYCNSNLKKAELFARREYPNWDCYGLELGHDFRDW